MTVGVKNLNPHQADIELISPAEQITQTHRSCASCRRNRGARRENLAGLGSKILMTDCTWIQ
jgi:hypothetical protein